MPIHCIFRKERIENAGTPGEFKWFSCLPIAEQRKRDTYVNNEGITIGPAYGSECREDRPLNHCPLENPNGVPGAIRARKEFDIRVSSGSARRRR